MKYRIQSGVVMETICGQSLLISTKEARKLCPYLTQLDESSAFIWRMLEGGRDTEEMIEAIIQEYEISGKEAEEGLKDFLNGMETQHLIVKEA